MSTTSRSTSCLVRRELASLCASLRAVPVCDPYRILPPVTVARFCDSESSSARQHPAEFFASPVSTRQQLSAPHASDVFASLVSTATVVSDEPPSRPSLDRSRSPRARSFGRTLAIGL